MYREQLIKMKTIKKIGVGLAFFIGVMSVFAGSKVLLGIDGKEYNVLIGLVAYNVAFGVISILTSYLLWKENKLGKLLMSFVLIAHLITLIYISNFSETAATESKMAMLFRLSIWVVISVLYVVIPKITNRNRTINLK